MSPCPDDLDFHELDDDRFICCGGREVHRPGCVNEDEDEDEEWPGDEV